MTTIVENYQVVIKEVKKITNCLDNLLILPVSKKKSVADIDQLYQYGIRNFAENYLQEALKKMYYLNYPDVDWHYIGEIQSRKTKLIAKNFNWVHSVDSFRYAKLLNDYRQDNKKPLNICIQVNIHEESQKNGVSPENALDLLQKIAPLPNLYLRGFMLIDKIGLSEDEAIKSFETMNKILKMAKQKLICQATTNSYATNLDTLSMGMSADWKLALQHGATIIRLGTTIFGVRE